MEQRASNKIIAADIMSGDLLIAFRDQRTALFPAAFLHEAIPQVQEIFDCEPDEEAEVMLHGGPETGQQTEDRMCDERGGY